MQKIGPCINKRFFIYQTLHLYRLRVGKTKAGLNSLITAKFERHLQLAALCINRVRNIDDRTTGLSLRNDIITIRKEIKKRIIFTHSYLRRKKNGLFNKEIIPHGNIYLDNNFKRFSVGKS